MENIIIIKSLKRQLDQVENGASIYNNLSAYQVD